MKKFYTILLIIGLFCSVWPFSITSAEVPGERKTCPIPFPKRKFNLGIQHRLSQSAHWQKLIASGNYTHVVWDENTQTPCVIRGPGAKLSATLENRNIETQTREFLRELSMVLQVDDSELLFQSAVQREGIWHVTYRQHKSGVPVYQGGVRLTINGDGKVPYIRPTIYPQIDVSTTPSLSLWEATKIAGEQVGFFDEIDSLLTNSLVILPLADENGVSYRLAWKLRFLIKNPREKWVYFIDAHSGEIIFWYEAIVHDEVYGTVRGYYYPNFPGDNRDDAPFELIRVDARVLGGICMPPDITFDETNFSGYYSITVPGPESCEYEVTASLAGLKHLEVLNHNGDDASYSGIATPIEPHNWTWDDDTPALDSEMNVYYHATDMYSLMLENPFNFDLESYTGQLGLRIFVNSASKGCQSSYDPDDDDVYIGIGDPPCCLDFGLNRETVFHEMGHCVTHNIYTDDGGFTPLGLPPYGECGAMDEGFADYWACTITDNSERNEGILVCEPYLDKIRNLDNTLIWPDDATGEEHHDGQIIGGALWDLRQNPNVGSYVTNDLFFEALWWFPFSFSEYMDAVLMAADEFYGNGDGVVDYNTPYVIEIFNSFSTNHHIYSSFFQKADVNADGEVDVLDAVRAANISQNIPPPPNDIEFWAADMDDDGDVDAIDVQKIVNVILGLPPDPPPPTTAAVLYLTKVPGQTGDYEVMLTNQMEVGIIQLWVSYDPRTMIPETPQKTSRSGEFDLVYNIKSDEITALLYNVDFRVVDPGSGSILYLPFQSSGGGNIRLARALLGTVYGQEIPIIIRRGGPPKLVSTEGQTVPTVYYLSQNYPNPFNPETSIEFGLPEDSEVSVMVYNMLGQVVEVLIDSDLEAGYYSISWYAKGLPTGVYFYRIVATHFTETKRMLLMK